MPHTSWGTGAATQGTRQKPGTPGPSPDPRPPRLGLKLAVVFTYMVCLAGGLYLGCRFLIGVEPFVEGRRQARLLTLLPFAGLIVGLTAALVWALWKIDGYVPPPPRLGPPRRPLPWDTRPSPKL